MQEDDNGAVELRAMRQTWRTMAQRWDLSPEECLVLLPSGGADDETPPRDTETRMRILIEIGYGIGVPEGMLHGWLRGASHMLGGLTPLDAMSGSLADLRGVRSLLEQGFAS